MASNGYNRIKAIESKRSLFRFALFGVRFVISVSVVVGWFWSVVSLNCIVVGSVHLYITG